MAYGGALQQGHDVLFEGERTLGGAKPLDGLAFSVTEESVHK